MPAQDADLVQLRAAIVALEAQRASLGDAVVDPALEAMRRRIIALESAEPAAEQQRKQATVLFADVVGFTTLSEMMDAEDLTGLINALWARLDRIVVAYGGRIDKHIGDSVMALWGADQAREDDPEQAVRAALAMQAEVDAFHSQLRDGRLPPGVPLEMRVGINTGPVLLGQVGLTREYTAIGDAVNLAKRLEQAAPLGGVLIAHDTYRHIRGLFDVAPQGPLAVRGRAEPVPVYVVQRPKPRAFRARTRGVEGVETRMIGRDDELAVLQAAFAEVVGQASPRVITIVGDAGVGKSRLLYEFDNWVEARPERVRYFKSRATASLQSVPYSLWRDMLAQRFDILDSDSPAVALSKFRKGMAVLPVGDGATPPAGAARKSVENSGDLVGHWLGFDFTASPAVAQLAGSPDFAALAQAQFLRSARAMAAERGVCVLLEDIHWADDSSLNLITRLAEFIPEGHLLIICLTRPSLFERHPNWGDRLANHSFVHLNPLNTQASRDLLVEILQRAEHIPDALCDLVVESAEGNPFYMEELVKMLLEQGVIVREPLEAAGERWRIADDKLRDLRVPATLTALLQARIDGLPRDERDVLQRAAVVGRVFWDEAVVHLDSDLAHTDVERRDAAPGPELIRPALDSLVRRELILRRDRSAFAGATEYTFKHNLLREVAYETVLLRDRLTLHARVARWLEVNAGARLSEYLGLIAEHYVLAGANRRAAAYLERAGDAAQRSGAYHSARAAYERALAVRQTGDQPAEISPLRLKLGSVLWNLGDFPAAERSLYFARDFARRSGDRRTQANALYWLSRVAISRGDYAQARMLLAYALPLARAADPETLGQILYGVADVAWKVGDVETLQTYVTESLALARAVGNTTLELLALNRLGTLAYAQGDLDTAHDYYQACIELSRSSGNLEREATALMNLGALAHRQGRPDEGHDYYRQALAHYRELGRSEQVVMALGNLAEAGVDRGDLDSALVDLREGLELAWRLELAPRLTGILYVYGRYLAARGERDRAAAVLRLVAGHPAIESQTRPQLTALLAELGCAEDGETAELNDVIAEVLAIRS